MRESWFGVSYAIIYCLATVGMAIAGIIGVYHQQAISNDQKLGISAFIAILALCIGGALYAYLASWRKAGKNSSIASAAPTFSKAPMMSCPKCRRKLAYGSKFCPACGHYFPRARHIN